MDRFEAFTAFVAVAENGSFVGAARQLGQTPVKVTRSIAWLEDHLGAPLFHRSTRHVAVSREGQALLERVRSLLHDVREAEQVVMGSSVQPQGELQITAPVMFGRLHVIPVVTSLIAKHPDLDAKMLLFDRNVRLIEEGIDVAVRIGHLSDSSMLATRLGSVDQVLVASPDYLAKHGIPRKAEDLAQHQCIGGSGVRLDNVWRFGTDGKDRVQLAPRLTINDVAATIAAACDGAGIANVLSYQVADQLRSGALVPVMEDRMPEPLPLHVIYPPSRGGNLAVRAFIAAMQERAVQEGWRD
tara:strand:- start:21574 stop:22470 length:897 start_codon:yes stop_codon:yes gene_type:complete